MQKKGVNVSLTSYDDIFSTEQDRTAPVTEEIRSVPLSQLHPFKDHPFKVLDDDAMSETVESVKQIGVVVPLIARPTEDTEKMLKLSGLDKGKPNKKYMKEV